MASSVLIEKRNEYDAKFKQLGDAFEHAKNSGAGIDRSFDDDKLAAALKVSKDNLKDEIKRRQTELEVLNGQVTILAADERMRELKAESERYGVAPMLPTDNGAPRKGLGTLFVEQIKNRTQIGAKAEVKINLKTLMQSDGAGGGGWNPTSSGAPALDLPGFTPKAVRPPQIIDFIPRFRTGLAAISFMEETTHTDNAVEKAQGAAAGEQAYAFTRQTRPVERIPAVIPVTDEQLEDVEGIEDFLNQALSGDLLRRLDLQCYAGNGTSPNLAGITDHADIQTQAKGTDPVFDAIHKAITKVNVTGRGRANVIFLHSNDWQDIVLTRTAEGIYVLGNPGAGVEPRLWGLPVVPNEACTENTGCVGDTTFTGLYMRQDVTLEVGYSGTQFVEGEKTVRATLRAAMAVRSGAKFCTVTGI